MPNQFVAIALLIPLAFWLSPFNFPHIVSAFLLTPEGRRSASIGSDGDWADQIRRRNGPLFRHAHPQATPEGPRNPIVLIPGDGGSRIRANLTGKPAVVHYFCDRHTNQYFDLWLNLQFGPFVIDCWADNMRLGFNASSGLAEDLPGVRVHIPGFGNPRVVEWLDVSKRSPGRYFAPIVESLVAWGYQRGVDVAAAPYDWRRAPKDLSRYFRKLRTLIESLYNKNNNRKVIVLAHSMGNPIANYFYHTFVDQPWKDKFLEAHISLAGAWGGAAQIVKLFAAGYNMDYYRVLLPPSHLRKMQRSFLSSAFLFPSDKLWAPTEILVSIPSQNYTLSNLGKFFADIEYPEGLAQWQSVRQSLILDPPGVKVFCIFGTEVDTPEQFVWKYDWFFPNYQPYTNYGDGDGTVNRRSLEVCEQWSGGGNRNNAGMEVIVHRLNGSDHMSILSDARTLTLLKAILKEAAKARQKSNGS